MDGYLPMNLSTCRHSIVETGKITFPILQCWNPITKVATIAAQVDGKRVSCRISYAALRKKFHALEELPMLAIVENRPVIEIAARKLIESKAYEEDGSIVIQYKDL